MVGGPRWGNLLLRFLLPEAAAGSFHSKLIRCDVQGSVPMQNDSLVLCKVVRHCAQVFRRCAKCDSSPRIAVVNVSSHAKLPI